MGTRGTDDDAFNMESQTPSRNSPSEMVETSNDSDIGNNIFPTSNLLSKESLHQYSSKGQVTDVEVSHEEVDGKNNMSSGVLGIFIFGHPVTIKHVVREIFKIYNLNYFSKAQK